MFNVLPPAGDPIRIRPRAGGAAALAGCWRPYRPHFYASGTAALAAAVTAAVRRSGQGRPEVVLPAYGCPALVAAVLHAGAKPVYADLQPDRPWLSLEAVARLLSPNTAAVVAVNFLGIPERLAALRTLLAGRDIALIEDSAQAFASKVAPEADLVVFSFGRGKPVSLLGGGAVLVRDAELAAALPVPTQPRESPLQLRVKAMAYNLLRQPACYWLPQMLPLGLGETRYEPLSHIDGMARPREQALAAAAEAYFSCRPAAQARLSRILDGLETDQLLDLPAACGAVGGQRLLRYPLLARDGRARDALVDALNKRGLGASKMYAAILPKVPAVPVPAAGALPAAQDFAERFFTLPVHEGVRDRHLDAMRAVLTRHCESLGSRLPDSRKNEVMT
jgi:dTDP-4-amino-4,6-dideoxygalactose transaminase